MKCALCKKQIRDGDAIFEINGVKWYCESCKVDIAQERLSERLLKGLTKGKRKEVK